jgi:hypothetical protein
MPSEKRGGGVVVLDFPKQFNAKIPEEKARNGNQKIS